MCCRFTVMTNRQEKKLLTKLFWGLTLVQSIIVTILCILSIYYFESTNVASFLSVDIVTLFIAVIFLSIIIIIVGWGSAVTNSTFAWAIYHIFMLALLTIEIMVSLYSSNLSTFYVSAAKLWKMEDERNIIQADLHCCGFSNFTNPTSENGCPSNAETSCVDAMKIILEGLRNISLVAMFFCLIFGLLIDFVGCAICFHPDIVTLDDQEHELEQLSAIQKDNQIFGDEILMSGFSNH